MFQKETARFDLSAPWRPSQRHAFLAAGTILFTRGEVHGLTTGAGMWLAGAIGLRRAIWEVAVLGTGLVLAVLFPMRRLEARLSISDEPKDMPPDANLKKTKD